MENAIRELGVDELDAVSGGLKNYVSKDVIDARGGQFTYLGLTFSYDGNGKLSDIS